MQRGQQGPHILTSILTQVTVVKYLAIVNQINYSNIPLVYILPPQGLTPQGSEGGEGGVGEGEGCQRRTALQHHHKEN